MSYADRFRVTPGSRVKLADIDPGFKDHRESHKEATGEISRTRRSSARSKIDSMPMAASRS